MKKVARSEVEGAAKMSYPTETLVGAVKSLQVENQRSKKRDGKILERLLNLRLEAEQLGAATDEKRRNKEHYEKLLKKSSPVLWTIIQSGLEASFASREQPPVSRKTRPTTSRVAVSSIKKHENGSVKEATDTSFEEEFHPVPTTPPKPIQQELFFTPLKQEQPKHTETEAQNVESREQSNLPEAASFLPLAEQITANFEQEEQRLYAAEIPEDTEAIQDRMSDKIDRKSPTASGEEVCKLPDNPPVATNDVAPKLEDVGVVRSVESPKVDPKGLTAYATLLLDQKSTSTAQKQDSSPELPLKKENTNPSVVKPTTEVPKPKISIFRADSDSESIGPPIQGAIGGQLTSTNDFDDFWD